MKTNRRRTRIVCTLGPASNSRERVRALIEAGMDVARLNFSHGTSEEHRATLEVVRSVAQELGTHVGVLQDLQGPKIRTGPVQRPPALLVAGATFTITTRSVPGDERVVSTPFAELPRDVHPGDRLFLSDGAIELEAAEVTDTDVRTRVLTGGTIGSETGINLPGVSIGAPSLTEKDERDLRFGLSIGVDFVALSFVRTAADVERAKDVIRAAGATTPLIAKLEKREAVEHLDEILSVADGVMVARGDLGVEISAASVPFVQKRIVEAANRCARPAITATQMLESMVRHPWPTRAEASDVANAVLDGTDAVMLSAETAIGDYPVEAVRTMASLAAEADAHLGEFGHSVRPAPNPKVFAEVIAEAASGAARRLGAAAIVARTTSGATARLVSKYRPPAPLLAVTADSVVARRTSLLWGVRPIVVTVLGEIADLVRQIDEGQIARDVLDPGDTVVLTATALGPVAAGSTNGLFVHRKKV